MATTINANHDSTQSKNGDSEKLDEIENQYAVAIFYACESGSRAWGFPSKDNDYDVRFLYIHPPG